MPVVLQALRLLTDPVNIQQWACDKDVAGTMLVMTCWPPIVAKISRPAISVSTQGTWTGLIFYMHPFGAEGTLHLAEMPAQHWQPTQKRPAYETFIGGFPKDGYLQTWAQKVHAPRRKLLEQPASSARLHLWPHRPRPGKASRWLCPCQSKSLKVTGGSWPGTVGELDAQGWLPIRTMRF